MSLLTRLIVAWHGVVTNVRLHLFITSRKKLTILETSLIELNTIQYLTKRIKKGTKLAVIANG
jgi:hypothetical protein